MARRRSKNQSCNDVDGGVLDRPTRTFHYAEDVIRKFDGRDKTYPITKWIQDIDDNNIFEWTQKQRLLRLYGRLSSEKAFKCWESLKLATSKEFPDAVDAKTIHEMMSAKKKRPNESCIDYMFAIKDLGKN
uniref:SFRICE_032591 n=1 Tax=Spodoptera frugiperda TaxID=7108 RepID=A0A2H1WUW9_SPOFR